ncbi:MAG: alpha/beta fold hydrolase [Peptococcaceae bacterium]|nr:alpha/beta fold hydrolase [Peptococcaceae bacterium]
MKKGSFGRWASLGLVSFVFVVLMVVFLAGCRETPPANSQPFEEYNAEDPVGIIAEKFVYNLVRDHYAVCATFFSEAMHDTMTANALRRAYRGVVKNTGAYQEIVRTDYTFDGNYHIYIFMVNHEDRGMLVRVVINESKKIDGLWFDYAVREEAVALPEGVVEEDITIDAGTGYPLRGKLTLPANDSTPVAAVVLVQGSGPTDMDETIYGNKPFRDLAYGLAERGIAVLRYDKRTFSYGEELSRLGVELTVVQESIEDAVAAWEVLAGDSRVDSARIYVLGHSLGGMLAPRIVDETKASGAIILAGSMRSLVDIIYDQNLYFIDQMPWEERQALLKDVADEYARWLQVGEMTEAEAKQETLFTLPAWYFAEMVRYPARGFLEQSAYPVLVLQGSKDFQVTEKDFEEYVALAKERPHMTTKLYSGLNHLFMLSTGGDNPDTEEYLVSGRVDPAVCEDIAEWIGLN